MLTYVLPKNGHRDANIPEILNETGHKRNPSVSNVYEYVYENNAIIDLSPVIYYWPFQCNASVVLYSNSQYSSDFCLSLTYCSIYLG